MQLVRVRVGVLKLSLAFSTTTCFQLAQPFKLHRDLVDATSCCKCNGTDAADKWLFQLFPAHTFQIFWLITYLFQRYSTNILKRLIWFIANNLLFNAVVRLCFKTMYRYTSTKRLQAILVIPKVRTRQEQVEFKPGWTVYLDFWRVLLSQHSDEYWNCSTCKLTTRLATAFLPIL